MTENLIHQLIPHQGCVISRTVDGIDNYSGIESAPSVGPCFGSTISLRECSITRWRDPPNRNGAGFDSGRFGDG